MINQQQQQQQPQPIICTCNCIYRKAAERKELLEAVQRAIADFTKPKEASHV